MGKRISLEYIKDYMNNEGYTLLSEEYDRAHTKLDVRCNRGHTYRVTWANFQQGFRCPVCSNNQRLTYDFIKGQIEKEGYTLLSKEYRNAHTKLHVECSKGHKYKVSWNNFNNSKRCPYCAGNIKHTYWYIKKQIEKQGYTLLSKEYKNAHTKLYLLCDKGHTYEASWNTFQRGFRCPTCYSQVTISKGEKELLEYIKSLTNTEVYENDRTQIINPSTGWNLELDIWIPSLNIAIEYNGEYWHSFEDTKERDMEKVKQCKEKGIKLFIIEDIEWHNNKEMCKEEIKKWLKE